MFETMHCFIVILASNLHVCLYIGRPQDNFAARITSRGYKDIVFGDYSSSLKAMRKIAHGALKAYGDGLIKLEKSVLQEVDALFKRFDKKGGEGFDPRNDISKLSLLLVSEIEYGFFPRSLTMKISSMDATTGCI